MARLLQVGDGPFMLTKLTIGAFAAFMLYRCAHLTIARRGMQLVLTIYVALMFAHVATGLSALGWSRPLAMIMYVGSFPFALFS